MTTNFIKSFPFYYYLSSRYSYSFERIFFLIKYFGFYFILLFVLGFTPDVYYLTITVFVLLLFYNIYDYFCYLNDSEDVPEYRKGNAIDVDYAEFKKLKGLYLLLFNSVFLILFGINLGVWCLALQFCLIAVFWMHNTFSFPVKTITFISLYFLKVAIFVVGLTVYTQSPLLEFVFLSMVFNLSYLPKYFFRKSSIEIKLNKVLIQPVIWKNLVLIPFVFVKYELSIVLIFVNILTLLEYLSGKILKNKKYEFEN